jgi:hypothetical protein
MERLGAAENPADIQLDARATDRLKGDGSSLTLLTYNYNVYISNAGAKRHLDVWRGSDLR